MFGGEIGFLRLGDKVEGGGEIISATGTGWMLGGLPAALQGDLARCDTHGGVFPLVDGLPDFIIDGKPAAFDKYRLACGCRVLSSCNGVWGLGKAEPVRYVDSFAAAGSTPAPIEPTRFTDTTTKCTTGVTLRIGLFFDGTNNNALNTAMGDRCRDEDAEALMECRPYMLKDDSSFQNGPTNVWRLYGLYRDSSHETPTEGGEYFVPIYVDGIGTTTGEADTMLTGQGLGVGKTGVVARVEQALDGLAENITRAMAKSPELRLDSIEFDMFGFSRGAAAARHAVNQVNRRKAGRLARVVGAFEGRLKADFDWARDIRVGFVGVFDTVIATGVGGMSLPRYPEYQDSGEALFERVPSHWRRSALKHLAEYQNGYAFKPEEWAEVGAPIIRIAQLTSNAEPNFFSGELDEKLRVCGGDLLFSWSATIDSFIWTRESAWLNQHIFKVSPTDEALRSFLFYLIKFVAPKLADLDAHGSTMRHIKKESLGQIVYVPPLSEQKLIASFLDREIAKIDALIAEQERLIALLAEKRRATITHAITRGLEPGVRVQPSSSPWLGSIPAHWRMTPLMRLTDPLRPIMYGIVLPGPDVGEGIPILKGGNVKPSRMNLESMARTTPEIEAPYARARLKAGDLVYSIRGSIGDCESVPPELTGSNITQDVARVAVADEVCASWVRWALLAHPIREDLASGSLGAAIRGVNIYDLKRVQLPTPPFGEQEAIAEFLDREDRKLEALRLEAVRAIGLLQEHRSALISAAVTGRIDVRRKDGA